MTHNQIDYWTLQEEKRHNVVGENENIRHNVVTENETKRHNVAGENFNIMNLQETARHNLVTENETTRHNLATEDIGYGNLELGYRNLGEQTRHNMATENISAGNLALGYANLGELTRHNKVGESANWASIYESKRHNRANEGLQAVMNEYTHQYQTTMGNAATSNAMQKVLETQNQEWMNHRMNEYYVNSNAIKQQEADIRQQEANTHKYSAFTKGISDLSNAYRNFMPNFGMSSGANFVPIVPGGSSVPLLP